MGWVEPRKIGEWSGRRGKWQEWFAWYPVTLGLHGRRVWLRKIKRRRVTVWTMNTPAPYPYRSWEWEYRG